MVSERLAPCSTDGWQHLGTPRGRLPQLSATLPLTEMEEHAEYPTPALTE